MKEIEIGDRVLITEVFCPTSRYGGDFRPPYAAPDDWKGKTGVVIGLDMETNYEYQVIVEGEEEHWWVHRVELVGSEHTDIDMDKLRSWATIEKISASAWFRLIDIVNPT